MTWAGGAVDSSCGSAIGASRWRSIRCCVRERPAPLYALRGVVESAWVDEPVGKRMVEAGETLMGWRSVSDGLMNLLISGAGRLVTGAVATGAAPARSGSIH